MKLIIAYVALVACTVSIRAAAPEEESRFLNAVREAYTKKDKDAVLALTCLDRVPERLQKMADQMFTGALFEQPIKSVQYVPVEAVASKIYQQGGVTYGPNLPVTKEIVIEYVDPQSSPKLTLFVGEKDGKLLISKLAPLP